MLNIYIESDPPGSSASARPESGQVLSSPSSASSAGTVGAQPGGTTISLGELLSQLGGAQRTGGTAAFLDINYGKSVAGQVGDIARTGGSAAFLDINYGKSVAGQAASNVANPESGQVLGPGLHLIDGRLYLVPE